MWKGSLLFDADPPPGQHFVVYKREGRRLETDENGNFVNCDGAWYHEVGMDVDDDNYKQVCEWSGIEEILNWIRASQRGDGVTGSFDAFAVDRANKFIVHPLVSLPNFTSSPDGWQAEWAERCKASFWRGKRLAHIASDGWHTFRFRKKVSVSGA